MSGNFNDLLELPALINKLREEIADLKIEVRCLREALPPNLLTVAQAAERLGYCEKTIRNKIKSGELARVGSGRSLRVDLTRKPVRSVNADDGRAIRR